MKVLFLLLVAVVLVAGASAQGEKSSAPATTNPSILTPNINPQSPPPKDKQTVRGCLRNVGGQFTLTGKNSVYTVVGNQGELNTHVNHTVIVTGRVTDLKGHGEGPSDVGTSTLQGTDSSGQSSNWTHKNITMEGVENVSDTCGLEGEKPGNSKNSGTP